MPKPPPSPLLRYGVVCLAVAGAMLLRWPLWPILGPKMPFLLLWPVVLFCAWYGGLGAGLLATLLSSLAAAYFLEARDLETVIGKAEWTGMIVFVMAGIISSGLAAWLSRAQRRDVSDGEWLRVILSSIGDAVIATDIRGRITFFNPVASQLTGWDQEEAIGKLLDIVFQVVQEQTRRVIENPILKVLHQDTMVSLPNNTVLVSKDGTERPIEDSAAPIRDDTGEVIGAVLVFHDITTRRQMEKELRQKADKLSAVDRHKEDFLALLAKELQNPVTGIFQGLEKLPLAGPDRQTVEQVRHMLERQFQHMSQLVDDLLDVVRLTRDKQQLRRDRLDLADLVLRTAESRRAALVEAGLVLALEVPKTAIWTTGDARRLTQALTILLDGEVKGRTRAAPLVVQLAADANRRQALITLTHAGMEVAPDQLPHLFDVFARGEGSLPQSQGRPGLGLALVKEMIELHGGDVRAISEGPGRGTKFLLRLPLEQEPVAIAEPPASPHPSAVRLRILVVEDNTESAEGMRMLLEGSGHEVAVAQSGAVALQLAGEWRPQIIFSDIGLPGMNGYELAAALRRNPATAKASLIAITGYGQEEDRRRCQEAGFDHHLVKPVEPHVLQSMVALQMLVPHPAETVGAGSKGS